MAADLILDDLRKVCDERARLAEDRDAVAGVPARYVAAPQSTQEVSEVLRQASEHRLSVVARGGGTTLAWGSAPSTVDLVLDMTEIAGVVEHAAGDLVVIARAGTRIETLQSTLAGAGQQLALDTPSAGATVGGVVAANISGPRRLLYGTLRDLLIGVTFVRADGVVAKSGGKVVKNVAGYDFGKLLTGSYGTLGVITEAAFRLHPLPPVSRFVSVQVEDLDEAGALVASVIGSQVVPTAVEVDQPVDGPLTVVVLLEGTSEGVEARSRITTGLLGDASAADSPPDWFGRYPFGNDDVGLKLTTQIAGLPRLLAAARSAAARHGVPIAVRGSAVGVLHAALPSTVEPALAAAVVGDLRSAAASYAGSVVVLTAPGPVREGLDVWGPVPGLDLMQRLKHELDPDRRLSPGRFVGDI
jgi:glycolate oxidase FAD binding subunit